MDQQSGGSGSSGEVRRIHVIYFLSRKGKIEQPHMIRVHHMSRNGVHLRDVKRWISDLRGKDMAESFSWSYKRSYKSGFVWQDLLDEDLITPISDNEYVIKGSEISSNSTDSNGDGKSSSKDQSMQEPTEKSTGIEQESPPCTSETSTTEESTKNEEQEEKASKAEKNSIYSTLLNRNKKVVNDIDSNNYEKSIARKSKVKNNGKSSTGASNVLRNIITCGAVDTNESGMVKINRRDRISLKTYTSKIIASIRPDIRKAGERGESERFLGSYSNLQQEIQSGRKSWDGVKISRKTDSISKAAFKPANIPNCSQCGKSFKPEQLHKHMKTCSGLRAFTTKSPIPTCNVLVNY